MRSLNIQLDEEHEIKADLEIENIKLKKRIQKLQTSLELVNNNCYDVDTKSEKLQKVNKIAVSQFATFAKVIFALYYILVHCPGVLIFNSSILSASLESGNAMKTRIICLFVKAHNVQQISKLCIKMYNNVYV